MFEKLSPSCESSRKERREKRKVQDVALCCLARQRCAMILDSYRDRKERRSYRELMHCELSCYEANSANGPSFFR